jgi:transcriptional antiterminator NusG
MAISSSKNHETGDQAGQRRALAIDKNLPAGHRRSWTDRLRHQALGFRIDAERWRISVEGHSFMEKKEAQYETKIFAVKTTTGQERNVARLIAAKVGMEKIQIKTILVPDALKGYVFIEADGPHLVEEAIAGVRHVRSRIPGLVSLSEIERYIVRKPVIEDLGEDDVVEITGGPFKSMRAKITRIDKSKGEVTLELLEATFTLPITVHSDYVKLVERRKKRSET